MSAYVQPAYFFNSADAVFTEISETYAPESWQAIGLGSGCLDEYSIQQQGYFTYNIFSKNTFFPGKFFTFLLRLIKTRLFHEKVWF